MELKDHFKIIKKAGLFILIFSVCVALAAFIFAYNQPEKYKASIAFDINMVNRPATDEYQYGSYYDLKGAEIFSQHVISWFLTPSVTAEIYEKAGIDYEVTSYSSFTNRFKAKQYSAQNVVVTFTDVYEPNANKLAKAIVEVVEKKTSTSAKDVENRSQWEARAAKTMIIKSSNPLGIVTALGFISGLIISICLVYLYRYFKTS
ncbi:MAG: hypothetical protein ABID45_01435 [Patescibacteria group bacterium]